VALLLMATLAVLLAGYLMVRQEKEQTERAWKTALDNEARAVAGEKQARAALDLLARRSRQRREALFALTSNLVEDLLIRQPELREQQRRFLRDAERVYAECAADPATEPEDRVAVAHAYSRLGAIRNRLGARTEAETAYKRALEVLRALTEDFPRVTDYRRRLALAHCDLGRVLADLGRWDPSLTEHRKALSLHAELAREVPDSIEYRADLGRIYSDLGTQLTARGAGDHDAAEDAFREAQRIQEALLARYPSDDQHLRSLGTTHHNFGMLLTARQRWNDAEKHYRRSLELQVRLAGDLPMMLSDRDQRSGTHNNLGTLLFHCGRDGEAEVEFRKALVLMDLLAGEFPSVPAYSINRAGVCCNIANLRLKSRRSAEALEWYERALASLAKLGDTESKTVRARAFRRNVLWGRCNTLLLLNRLDEADRDSRDALRLCTSNDRPSFQFAWAELMLARGDHPRTLAALEALSSDKAVPAALLYRAACLSARAGSTLPEGDPIRQRYAARALALLQRSRDAGHFREEAAVEELKRETIFDWLRERPEFGILLDEIQTRSPRESSPSSPR
jgi:tetratricopeptide (TPR) repeat protein